MEPSLCIAHFIVQNIDPILGYSVGSGHDILHGNSSGTNRLTVYGKTFKEESWSSSSFL